MKKVILTIEKHKNEYVGRVNFEENLIIDHAKNLIALESKLKKLLNRFHDIDISSISFQHRFDLTALFDAFNFLKISNVAEIAGINPSLLRQYVTGNKQASATQAKKIEDTIHKIARELSNIQIHGTSPKL